jgi:hypothetical protein
MRLARRAGYSICRHVSATPGEGSHATLFCDGQAPQLRANFLSLSNITFTKIDLSTTSPCTLTRLQSLRVLAQ